MSRTRQELIEERRKQIPKMYRGIYDKAVSAKNRNRKAAIIAQCLECCGWQRIEVARCTDKACPLWMVRPYQESSYHCENRRDIGAELQKSCRGDNYASN